jgi:peptide/nickel transport system ATP-binding protein
MDPLLEVRNLTVSYSSGKASVKALDRVNLVVESNEILAVVGESGSGKSTLAKAIMGMIKPPGKVEGGEILLQGEDILKTDQEKLRRYRWERVSIVPQASQNALNPTMRIAEHFQDVLRYHGVTDQGKIREITRSRLEEVGLDPDRVASLYPHELSGGMKQRVLIGLALVLEPSLVILDEPTSALDALNQRLILDLVKGLQRSKGISVLFITHDISLVGGFADRTMILYFGRVMEIAQTERVMSDPYNPYTILLLKALPSLTGSVEGVKSIPGEPPDPRFYIKGCKFHTRCPLAQQICAEVDPDLTTVAPGHLSACHFSKSDVLKSLKA